MNTILALIFALMAFGAFRAAQDYVRRSISSFNKADTVLAEMVELANEFLALDIPEQLACLVVETVAATGCGCFVRGMIVNHYWPAFGQPKLNDTTELSFMELESLDIAKRELFGRFIVTAIVFDSFRNPLQGWLFRKILFSRISDKKPTVVEQMEARITAFSVLSKRELVFP